MPRWTDEGIVLSARPFGENGALLTCFTHHHGLSKGLVKGARRKSASLQAGTHLSLTWSARLEEHLGTWTLEALSNPSGKLLSRPLALAALSSALALTESVLPEREPQEKIFHHLLTLLEALSTSVGAWTPIEPPSLAPPCNWYEVYTLFEIMLLKAAGFRLSLNQCVATGQQENLIYVSPRSGGAVSQEAGAPYHHKLLPLPAYLHTGEGATEKEFLAGLGLTEYFFDRYILEQANTRLPAARNRFKNMVHTLSIRKG